MVTTPQHTDRAVFEEANEGSNATAGTDHDHGNCGLGGEAELRSNDQILAYE